MPAARAWREREATDLDLNLPREAEDPALADARERTRINQVNLSRLLRGDFDRRRWQRRQQDLVQNDERRSGFDRRRS